MSDDDGKVSWVDAPDETGGGILTRYAQALDARLATRIQNWEIFAAVYSETLEVSLRPSRARRLAQPSSSRNANLTFNVSRSLVETEHATVTEADPRPTVITEDANRPLQDKARELQRAIDGVCSDHRVYATIARCELDKDVLGGGVTKVHRVGNRPAIDRVLISDILVDEDLVVAGQDPKQIIHRMEVSRRDALTFFKDAGPEIKKAIEDAPAVVTSSLQARRADLIVLYDAYTAALSADVPGVHAISIENYEPFAFKEPWTKPRLPFVFQMWQRPTTGFYPIGIIEQVIGIQVEINRFFRNVSKGLKRWGNVICLIPTTGKINTQLWTNHESGQFIPYDPAGGTPQFMNAALLSPDVMNWLEFNIDNAYKVTGIPQNTAFAQREAGIPSARGQREISQKAASRLAPQSKQYERAFVDVAWLIDDIIRDIKADGEELEISTVDQGALHKVEIDEAISLEPGTYRIDIFAGNLLSRHPASKKEEIKEFTATGIFSKEEAKQLVLRPDVEAAIAKDADVAGIYKRQIDQMIKKGKYTPPEEYWPNKDLGKKLFADALFENQAVGVPDDRLQLLRDWLVAMKDIMTAQVPPPAATSPDQPQQSEAA